MAPTWNEGQLVLVKPTPLVDTEHLGLGFLMCIMETAALRPPAGLLTGPCVLTRGWGWKVLGDGCPRVDSSRPPLG